ncbi:MAG: PIN domain-containing protein [Burkholderiales bacterium]|nr:PIN domain-containing protein [Burkholderiales bacterium]
MHRGGDAVLLDTSVLVAILTDSDPRHEAANAWLAGCTASLHTVEAVLTETSYFLPASRRSVLADMAAAGAVHLHHPDAAAHKRVGAILRKYTDLRADWADAVLVWLAEESGIHKIATFDVRDFSTYRINGRSKFILEAIA